MVDLILLVLLVATAILFMALTLDEVTRRTSNRSSPARSDEPATPLIVETATDDETKQAA